VPAARNAGLGQIKAARNNQTEPDEAGRIPTIVATLATDGWDRIGFNE
jgi:hypothetical protein